MIEISCSRRGRPVFAHDEAIRDVEWPSPLSGPSAVFRLSGGHDLLLTISLHQGQSATVTADIAFRFLQRLALSTAERLEHLLAVRKEALLRADAATHALAVASRERSRAAETPLQWS
jgi:UDP-GlcNAc:undecaprenyl-phosphate GlcNAc-1-phosphate transferase